MIRLIITFFKSLFSSLNNYQAAEKALTTATELKAELKFKKWILPVFTYALTLCTGIIIGALVSKMQIHRAQQLDVAAALREQSLLDSLQNATQLAQTANIISQKDETILHLRQQLRSDSIAHLSELEAIRAINAHLKSKR